MRFPFPFAEMLGSHTTASTFPDSLELLMMAFRVFCWLRICFCVKEVGSSRSEPIQPSSYPKNTTRESAVNTTKTAKICYNSEVKIVTSTRTYLCVLIPYLFNLPAWQKKKKRKTKMCMMRRPSPFSKV